MSEVTDRELLDRFTKNESDEAFAAIVDRYIHLVHSLALRHTANPHYAEEITQAVFIILARKAASLDRGTILSGWLYHTARLTAANFSRSELRRSNREHESFMQSHRDEEPPQAIWNEVLPFLDGAMARLGATDRDALVLRYFENKSLSQVGKALGVSERAAQKRVSRALEKLRHCFAQRGITATAAILATEISTRSVQSAPLGLANKVTATAMKGSAAAGSTLTLVKGTLHVMTWLKAKTAIILGSAALVIAGAGVAIAHHNRSISDQNDAQALQNKLEAERAGGSANVAPDPNAEKLEDEQKALHQQQTQGAAR
jgi:RNA polymerase sigma factor (sigma-70 family)